MSDKWRDRSTCRDPALVQMFLNEPYAHGDNHRLDSPEMIELYERTASVCASCPVQAQCREYALSGAVPQFDRTMYAGLDPKTRRKLLANKRREEKEKRSGQAA